MRFQRVNGKMIRVDESTPIQTWTFPDKPTAKSRRDMKDIPLATLTPNTNKGYYASSSVVAGIGAVSLATINPSNGIFWETFMVYLFPWFLDVAQVFCAIKVAQAFYQENRGGRDSGTGMGAIITYGKWLLLFHMIPFFVKLIDELGQRMADSIG